MRISARNLLANIEIACIVLLWSASDASPTGYSCHEDLSYSRMYDAHYQAVVGLYTETTLEGKEPQRRYHGSGFFISPGGEIITNFHVITGNDSPIVKTASGAFLKATVVSVDAEGDLSLLKIHSANSEQFPYLELGNSENVRIGDAIANIGGPHGLEWTLTVGIKSGPGRIFPTHLHELIQLQAFIKPGSSGSPVLACQNGSYRVIGIAQSYLDDAGFAIPIEVLENALPALRHPKIPNMPHLAP